MPCKKAESRNYYNTKEKVSWLNILNLQPIPMLTLLIRMDKLIVSSTSIYSRKVLNFLEEPSSRSYKTDYAGEISAYGDSVKIIKEPVISVSDYTRNRYNEKD